MLITVGIGLLISAVLLVIAIRRGRARPTHRVPWIIAIVVLSLDVAFHVILAIAAIVAGGWEAAWLPLGTLAIAGVLGIAFLQPRIAGWWFIASAALMPLVLAVTQTFDESAGAVPLVLMLAVYSSRALIVGGLLVFSVGLRFTNTRESATSAMTPHTTFNATLAQAKSKTP